MRRHIVRSASLTVVGLAGADALLAAGASTAVAAPAPAPSVASTQDPGAAGGSASSTTLAAAARLKSWVRRAVHAEIVVRTKSGFETVDVDRGTVTAASSGSITIQRADGVAVSATVTSGTRYRGLPSSQVTSGDQALLVEVSGDARVIASRPPRS